MDVWVFVLAVGSTIRLTRFAAKDDIFEPLRLWVVNRVGPSTFWLKVATCQPCASVWVSGMVAPLGWWWGHTTWFMVGAFALTLSAVTTLVAINFDRD